MMLATGTRLGPYEIEGIIGVGGMGEVYKARDPRLDRTVAIKVVTSLHSDEARQRFDSEARVIAALEHPHICVVYDVGHDGGVDYLVMEYLEGETLAARLTRGPLPIGDAVRYAGEIAEALDCAHQRGIVHRDLKPANVMMTAYGAKLLDFGIAKLQREPAARVEKPISASGPVTAPGTFVGTMPYVAPEVLYGEAAVIQSDIWAFGVTLHEMVSGRLPFAGSNSAELTSAVLTRAPLKLPQAVPPAIRAVVRRALEKNPAQRQRSARALVEELAGKGLRLRDRREIRIGASVALAASIVAAIAVVNADEPAAGARQAGVQTAAFSDSVSLRGRARLELLVTAASVTGTGFRVSVDDSDPFVDVWTSAQCVVALIKAGSSAGHRSAIRAALAFMADAQGDRAWRQTDSATANSIEVTAWVGLAFLEALVDSSLWKGTVSDGALTRMRVRQAVQKAYRYIAERQSPQGGWSSRETESYVRSETLTDYSTFTALRFLIALKRHPSALEDTAAGDKVDEHIERGLRWILGRYDPEVKGWTEHGAGVRLRKDLATLYLVVLLEADGAGISWPLADPRTQSAIAAWTTNAVDDATRRATYDVSALTQNQQILDRSGKRIGEASTGVTVVWYAWTLMLAHHLANDSIVARTDGDRARSVAATLLGRIDEAARGFSRGYVFSAAETLYALGTIRKRED